MSGGDLDAVVRQDNLPKPPRADCRRAATWGAYYQRCAEYYHGISDAVRDYPFAARHSTEEARRFQAGADEIAAGRHAKQIAKVWK